MFSTVCLNTSIFPSLSDFIPQSTDPIQNPQAPSSTLSLSRASTVPPTAATPPPIDSTLSTTATTTHASIIMSAMATISSQAKGKTPIRNPIPASPYKRSYAQTLAAAALPLSPFSTATTAISEPPTGSSKTYHSTAYPVIKLVVEDSYRYLPTVNNRPIPPHNAHHPASVAAAKFRVTHATLHFTACCDTTCITHWASHTNNR